MIKKAKISWTFLLGIFVWMSCSKDQGSVDYSLRYPDYFPAPIYPTARNPITKKGFELGRALFHDPILSVDSTISCASCHSQGHAFADQNVSLSTGVYGRVGPRNSPSIINTAWQSNFMWDGGVNHIEVVPVAPITNHLEMDESIKNLVYKLNQNPKYLSRFKQAFDVEKVDDQKVFFALAQYMSMLVSADAKYDMVQQGKATFTSDEALGYTIFNEKCGSCHREPLFTDYSYSNNGLSIIGMDLGRYTVTLLDQDKHKFKVPTLRNIQFTYPYMHDGRFSSIAQVLNHYSNDMASHENLDQRLVNGDKVGIALTIEDKKHVEAFLKTLSDFTFISDPKLSE